MGGRVKPGDRLAIIAKAAAPKRHAYLLVLSETERGHRRFVQLPDATVLGWFRRNWSRTTDQRTEELGGHVYGLESVFDEDNTNDDRPDIAPVSDDELIALLDRTIYSEEDHEVRTHYIAVRTDDDEFPIYYWFFDDDFLSKPGAWEELPDVRTGTALEVIARMRGDGAPDRDDNDDDRDEDRAVSADAYERFYRKRHPA